MYILIMLTVLKLHLVYQIKLSDFCSFCCLGKAHRLPPLKLKSHTLQSFKTSKELLNYNINSSIKSVQTV